MTIPKLSLSGDPQGDAQVVKRARRQVNGWRIRALLLALIAGLFFFRLRRVLPGVIFVRVLNVIDELRKSKRIGEREMRNQSADAGVGFDRDLTKGPF